jgi:REP-associated tyrosine transposase
MKGRKRLAAAMEQRKELEHAGESEDRKRLRRGWCCGSEGFRQELLELIGHKQGKEHYGEELRESDEQKAERLVKEMLDKNGWLEEELKRRRKGDGKKAGLAARLRRETALTWEWIARRLTMGHWRTAANAVRKHNQR